MNLIRYQYQKTIPWIPWNKVPPSQKPPSCQVLGNSLWRRRKHTGGTPVRTSHAGGFLHISRILPTWADQLLMCSTLGSTTMKMTKTPKMTSNPTLKQLRSTTSWAEIAWPWHDVSEILRCAYPNIPKKIWKNTNEGNSKGWMNVSDLRTLYFTVNNINPSQRSITLSFQYVWRMM